MHSVLLPALHETASTIRTIFCDNLLPAAEDQASSRKSTPGISKAPTETRRIRSLEIIVEGNMASRGIVQTANTNQPLPEQSRKRHDTASYVPTDFVGIESTSNSELAKLLQSLLADNDAIEAGNGQLAGVECYRFLMKSIKNVDKARGLLFTSGGGEQDASERVIVYRQIHGQLYRRLGLTQESRSCAVCGEMRRPNEISGVVTRKCVHASWCCKPCVKNWIAAQLETHGWDHIKCPECPNILSRPDVRKSASKGTYKRYSTLRTRAELSSHPNWRFCLSPTCESGQMHPRKSGSVFICKSCGHKSCSRHNVPWHTGETCSQFERRRSGKLQTQETASENWKTLSTKICPKCGIPIEKDGGCDTMSCIQCSSIFHWSRATGYVTPKIAQPEIVAPGFAAKKKPGIWGLLLWVFGTG